MLLRNRKFERSEPHRDAKKVFIFCEGLKREKQYFQYFLKIDSRINLIIHPFSAESDNSPHGLLKTAQQTLNQGQYDYRPEDHVFLVFDKDPDRSHSREPQISAIFDTCREEPNWNATESNPCFEVWLLYHVYSEVVPFEGDEQSSNWKKHLNTQVVGGFDSRKMPILLSRATQHAKANYHPDSHRPEKGQTQLFKFGEVMLPYVEEKLYQGLSHDELEALAQQYMSEESKR
ncbi:RloB family protein [Pontibacter sp. G13]|uniref:RloB family protein n=1 Tax=Pontibacter sp. G13 TaxID=3074898 RepID=UPI00288BD461|nr:RloB family protein [Pontibacter sp. G13]WNJ17680.1 RloB family protein [Pontibacter sp. G13]